MKKIDTAYFPGWTRKSVTFTIDDGVIEHDRKFLSIVKPRGIKGTFNLHHAKTLTPEEYREMYSGYEIANHCRNHPMVFRDGYEYKFKDEPLDRENSSVEYLYPSSTPGVYFFHISLYINDEERKKAYLPPKGWHPISKTEDYLRFADECHDELEEVFGEGSVRSFAYPHGAQYNAAVVEYLKNKGYYGIRKTGHTDDKDGFRLPENWLNWTYSAHHGNLLEIMEKFERYPDEGELKMFALGVHSKDFETYGKWDDLCEFAEKYGNRPEDFFYATVAEIFDYQKAVENIKITEDALYNPSDITLYLTVDGERTVLGPKSKIDI